MQLFLNDAEVEELLKWLKQQPEQSASDRLPVICERIEKCKQLQGKRKTARRKGKR